MVLKFTRINERLADQRPETAIITSIRDTKNGKRYMVGLDCDPGFDSWAADPEEVRETEPDYTNNPTHVRIYREEDYDDDWPWCIDAVDDFGNYVDDVWRFETHEQACAKIDEFIESLRIEGYEFKSRKRGGFSIHQ